MLTVHLPAVAYFDHENEKDIIVDFVENPVVADTNAIGFLHP
jgi:hypothetical protein